MLIYVGLVAGGIENLNEDEMSDLFDQYCFCKQEHSGEALFEMRNRLMQTLKREAEVWRGACRRVAGAGFYAAYAIPTPPCRQVRVDPNGSQPLLVSR
jgi:hypothetical protein